MALSFAFDPAKGETPQSIQHKRDLANLITAQMLGHAPKNVGEGLNALGQALASYGIERDANSASAAGAATLPTMFGGTGADTPTPSANIASMITGQPPASQPMGQTSIPSGTIDPRLSDAISNVSSVHPDVDPAYLSRLAMVENSGKIEGGSPLSSAQGPFQFLKGTAKQYGLSNPNDPTAAAEAVSRLTEDNRAALTRSLGREPTPGELYLAHQQGQGGAIKLLQNPNAPVESIIGGQAARNNAATPGMTAGQFAGKWTGKFNDIVQNVDPSQKNILDAQADGPVPMQPVAPTAAAQAVPAPIGADDPAALPDNSQPAQYNVPGQGVPAPVPMQPQAAQPKNRFLFKNASDEQLQQALLNPHLSEHNRPALMQEYKMRAEAAQKAADPAHALAIEGAKLANTKARQDLETSGPTRALDMEAKGLAIKKAKQELEKSDFEWKPIGKDDNNQWTYGYVNSKTMEVRDKFNRPIQAAQQAADETAGLNGEDYLKAIPRDRADNARKIANGDLDVALLPNRGDYRTKALADAARFDPTFSPADYKTRLATRKDFTSGKSAQNITSFNTAIGHLDTLDKTVDELGNRSSSWYNMASAPVSMQSDPHYQKAVKDFRVSKQAVADELSRAFKGAGGTVHDITEWEKTISETDSPAALHAATKKAVDLLHSRIDAVGDQYNRGMGKTADPVSLLSPKAQATLDRLEGGGNVPQVNAVAPVAPATGVDPAALAEARRRRLIK